MSTVIYLASPYTKLSPEARELCFQANCKVAAQLFNAGYHVIAPIIGAHPIAIRHDLPVTWEFWAEYDKILLSVCTEIWVLMYPGWSESTGIQAEIALAIDRGLRVKYIDPEEYGVEIC